MLGERGTVSDRAISALAIVKVSFDRRQSFLSYFEPFLEHCMLKSEHDAVSIPDLRGDIQRRFGLWLPQAVIKTLLRRQEAQGHVQVERDICTILRETLEEADLEGEQREAMRQQTNLIRKLMEFAETAPGTEKSASSLDEKRAQELLLDYVEQFSARLLNGTIAGDGLPAVDPTWERDQQIVHRFVLHAEARDSRSFEFLTVLVKGKMLSDAVYLGSADIEGVAEPLEEVQVYIDTPILLRLLGYAGEGMAAAYLELLEMLKVQKALTRCYDVNVDEAKGILSVAERAARGEIAPHARSEVVRYLAANFTAADIALMKRRLPQTLLKAGIQPVPLPPAYRKGDRPLMKTLERGLRGRNPKYPDRALAADVKTAVAIHDLRQGDTPRSLASCQAVFVTRNYDLYKASIDAFQQHDPGPTIPTCIPMSAFTTMVWVRKPLSAPDLPRDRIIADAYAAMNPTDDPKHWREVSTRVREIQIEGDATAADAQYLREHGESEHALREGDLNEDGPFTEGTVEQVRRHAERRAREEAQRRLQRAELVARCIARVFARGLFAVVFPLLLLGIVFGPLGLVDSSSPVPAPVQWVGTALFLLLGIWSLADGISLHRLGRRAADGFERVAKRLVFRVTGIRTLPGEPVESSGEGP